MEFIIIFLVILPICAAIVASNKRRTAFGWLLLTLLFPPLFVILLCLPPLGARLPSPSA